jgi:hypothetical protein
LEAQARDFVEICKPKSFSLCSISGGDQLLLDKDFLRNLYSCLDDGAAFSVKLGEHEETIWSLLKMTGFINFVQTNSKYMTAYKPVFKSGGTSLKERKALAQKNE